MIFSQHPANHKGFTLLEILVVIILIASFVGFALPRFQNRLELHLKKQARMLSTTIQYLYNQAALKNITYRLHYDLDEHQYWIESSKEKIELSTESEEEKNDFFRIKDKDTPSTKFKSDRDLLKKPVHLEKRIHFLDIKTEAREEPITSGHAYTHFFPHGYAEETKIRIKSEDGKIYTISVSPLTGNARVYDYDFSEEK